MRKIFFLLPFLFVSSVSCTYSITQIHTAGEATDVIDETQTPTANVSPQVTIPGSVIGK